MDNRNMSAGDLVSALRKKSEYYKNIANAVEQNLTSGEVEIPTVEASSNTVEALKKYMGNKAFRSVQLAKHFNMSREDVDKLLTTVNGFTLGERGWIFVSGNSKFKAAAPQAQAPVQTLTPATV